MDNFSFSKLKELGIFEEIELQFALTLQYFFKIDDEDILSLGALTFLYYRYGHICLKIENNRIYPPLRSVIQHHDSSYDQMEELESRWCRAFSKLPSEICSNCDDISSTPLIKDQCHLYLHKAYALESALLTQVACLMQPGLTPISSNEILENRLHALLSKDQKKAWDALLRSPLSFLLGGPGTGKSHTIGVIASCFQELTSGAICIAAPTGKATLRLKKSLEGKISGQTEIATLHSLLKVGRAQKTLIHADLIIIDECSMIDLSIWEKLFASLPAKVRILLVGDNNQLPPVESGSIFSDLTHAFERVCKESITYLHQNLRVEEKEIAQFAKNIELKSAVEIMEELKKESSFLHYTSTIDKGLYHQLADAWERSQRENSSLGIITPLKDGPWGVNTLNEKLHHEMLKKNNDSYPIIITKNDYSKNLFNGEVGVVAKDPATGFKKAYFSHGREFFLHTLFSYELAYAVSVHKSQGSEYDHVIVLMPEGASHFGKQLFYTAVTRAKKKITIYGLEKDIQKCLDNSLEKHSQLTKRLLKCF